MNKRVNMDEFLKYNRVEDLHLFKLIREVIFNTDPEINEKLGNGIMEYVYHEHPLCSLSCSGKKIILNFFHGEQLSGKNFLIHGNGDNLRYLVMFSREDLDPFIIYYLLKQSIQLINKEA